MVIIDEKYAIIGSGTSFILAVKGIKKNKQTKKNEEIWINQTYHSSIQSAIRYYIKLNQINKLNSKKYKSLKEVTKDFEELQNDIMKRIKV